MYRVGIDIGGTFTDMLLVGEDGSAVIGKTLTTPGDPSLAVENALRPVLENGTVKTGARGTRSTVQRAGDQRADRAQRRADSAAHHFRLSRRRRDRREHRYELYDLNLGFRNLWCRATCVSTCRSAWRPTAV
jgi:N-methylhydantoinase A